MLVSHDAAELAPLLLALDRNLLSDFLLDLFECLEEELLDFAPLAEHHLSQRSDVLELPVLSSEHLSASADVMLLILDDLLMLELQQLLLLFKVVHDLLETLLEEDDFVLQRFDLFLLLQTSFLVLLGLVLLQRDASLLVLDHRVHPLLLSLVEVKQIPLTHGLLGQCLVLVVDGSLDALDVPKRILLSHLPLEKQLVLELLLHFPFHARLLDLDLVLFLLDGLLKARAVLLPRHELKFVL